MTGTFIGQCKAHIKRGYTRYKLEPNKDEESKIGILTTKLFDSIATEIAEKNSLPVDYVKEHILKLNITYDILDSEIRQLYDGDLKKFTL